MALLNWDAEGEALGNTSAIETLPSPVAVREGCVLSKEAAERVCQARVAIQSQIQGVAAVERLIAVVDLPEDALGSADGSAVLAFVKRLWAAQQSMPQLLIVFLVSPRRLADALSPEGGFGLAEGMQKARRLLAAVVEQGLCVGLDLCDTISSHYVYDLAAYGKVAAPLAESQPHREVASSLPFPIGFHCGSAGNVQLAHDAMTAAAAQHACLSVNPQGQAVIETTKGNACGHAITPARVVSKALDSKCCTPSRGLLVDVGDCDVQCSELCSDVSNGERRIRGFTVQGGLDGNALQFMSMVLTHAAAAKLKRKARSTSKSPCRDLAKRKREEVSPVVADVVPALREAI
eukprot:Hpha_TRINITY_DN15037_c0_g3::TRINITY_DN15037_c0_g3_i1::g.126001::m.126001/K01626/E2.5.1.54, aroF, aroG, aroH; 3-deoxy-7-phosphoheptulonate synthase